MPSWPLYWDVSILQLVQGSHADVLGLGQLYHNVRPLSFQTRGPPYARRSSFRVSQQQRCRQDMKLCLVLRCRGITSIEIVTK